MSSAKGYVPTKRETLLIAFLLIFAVGFAGVYFLFIRFSVCSHPLCIER